MISGQLEVQLSSVRFWLPVMPQVMQGSQCVQAMVAYFTLGRWWLFLNYSVAKFLTKQVEKLLLRPLQPKQHSQSLVCAKFKFFIFLVQLI